MSLEWLPELIEPEDGESIHGEYLDRVFAIYERDLVYSRPSSENYRFGIKIYPDQFGWPATFWHLISEGEPESQRILKIQRSKYIAWVRPLIDEFLDQFPNFNTGQINWWQNSRKGKTRLLVSTINFEYLVVLELRKNLVLFCTAYPTTKRTAEKLQREFEEFWR
jgi:hypothetical protein